MQLLLDIDSEGGLEEGHLMDQRKEDWNCEAGGAGSLTPRQIVLSGKI